MKIFFRALFEIYDKQTNIFCLLVAAVVLAIDYTTGKHIEFPILYALPVGLTAWKLKKIWHMSWLYCYL